MKLVETVNTAFNILFSILLGGRKIQHSGGEN